MKGKSRFFTHPVYLRDIQGGSIGAQPPHSGSVISNISRFFLARMAIGAEPL